MDKRILKTKAGLKEALRRLLSRKMFEDITVTEICDEARTGRLTFYKYYSDKKDLLKEVFRDIADEISERYDATRPQQIAEWEQLQEKTRLEIFRIQLEYFTDALIGVLGQDPGMVTRVVSNSGMMQMLMQEAMKVVEKMFWEAERTAGPDGDLPADAADAEGHASLQNRYDRERLNAFLTMGIWGFLSCPSGDAEDVKKVQMQARQLIRDITGSGIFR